MALLDLSEHPHRRLNLLTGEWLLVSPHRGKRPWSGDQTPPPPKEEASYHPQCHLCPGNARANGTVNPAYSETYAFSNDFPALTSDLHVLESRDDIFKAMPAAGEARVLCFSPHHSHAIPDLDQEAVRRVVDLWCFEVSDLSRKYAYVQVFENKGAMMGCSSPHPHGQIWASDFVPPQVEIEDSQQAAWLDYVTWRRANGLPVAVARQVLLRGLPMALRADVGATPARRAASAVARRVRGFGRYQRG